jgi:Zn-dependent peptidase ImmA (M78 family)
MIEEIANETSRLYGSDPTEVLDRLGLEIIEYPLAGRIKEIYFGDFVVLSSGAEPLYRDYYLAHALGHHLIHKHGNYLYCDSISHLKKLKRESEAEDFAAFFLIPEKKLLVSLREYLGEPLATVADALQVATGIACSPHGDDRRQTNL